MRAVVLALIMLGLFAPVASARSTVARVASVCADYSDQAAAQRAADTFDGDGDGVYCVISPQ